MRRVGLLLGLLAVVVLALPASADPKPARTKPQGPAAVKFAKDFPALKDSEWGWRLGGFGACGTWFVGSVWLCTPRRGAHLFVPPRGYSWQQC